MNWIHIHRDNITLTNYKMVLSQISVVTKLEAVEGTVTVLKQVEVLPSKNQVLH